MNESRTGTEPNARHGGNLVVEILEEFGAKALFRNPGQHAFGLFDVMAAAICTS